MGFSGDFFSGRSGTATVVATTSLLPGSVDDGRRYYVTSQKATYEGIGGQWQRTVTSESWVEQTTWYIASTGTADATGASNDSPVTLAELFARLGNHPIPAGITVYVLDSISADTLIYHGTNEPDNEHWLYFEGVPAVAATGTIATVVTAWNAASNGIGVITGSASLASHVGKCLRITGGARQGARFLIAANPSGAQVRISRPRDGAYSATAVDIQVGDPYEVLTLPELAQAVTVLAGTDVQFALVRLGVDPHGIIVQGAATFDACQIVGVDVGAGGSATLYACHVGANLRAQGHGSVVACGCVADATTCRLGGTMSLRDHLIQGGALTVEAGGAVRIEGAAEFLAVCDKAASGVVLEETASLIVKGYLIGSGITGGTTGRVSIDAGAVLTYDHLPDVDGTGWETGIGGYERTFAQWPYSHPNNDARAVLGTADASGL